MTRAERALAKMSEAAAGMKRATELWNAADPVRVDDCRAMIEHAARDISEAEEILRSGETHGPSELRAQATQIRSEAFGLQRLVDAASTFLKGAFPEIAGCAPVYGCAGTIVSEANAVARGLQA